MITSENLLKFLKTGLENLHLLNPKCQQILVKEISIVNDDNLCCVFYPKSSKSNDIKLEIVSIMGFFNGFFRENLYENISFSHYLVRAFNSNNDEILYALSTKSTAELIGTGKAIEWYKLTLFQENTDDFRLTQAKQIISELENCLREFVKLKLYNKYGEDWWNLSLNNKLGNDVKETYKNQFGEEINDGSILVQYTFTLQLKKIISTHFNLFKSYFSKLEDFNTQMDLLNKIRREEAHNRTITTETLEKLKELHEKLISKALVELTNFQSVFLNENWKLKVKKIMSESEYKPKYNNSEIQNENNLLAKLIKIRENIDNLIVFLDEKVVKLKSIVVPIQKKDTQKDIVFYFEKLKNLQQNLLKETETLNTERISEINSEIQKHQVEMDIFSRNFLINEG